MSNKEIGNFGENKAATYLTNLGFTLLYRNWRQHHLEIDIIASKDKLLHIVEVKTRTSIEYGYPEKFISKQKNAIFKKCSRPISIPKPPEIGRAHV